MQRLWTSIRSSGEDAADEFSRFLNGQPYFILFCFSILVLGATAALSRAKPFWYDEIHTFYICGLPTLADSLHAVRDGADLNPPFLYFFTRASQFLFGASEVATRLPATFGFLLMQLSLFGFIARRSTNAVAFAAICFPLLTGAHSYAYEARPYGLLLGFCALSAWMWQRLTDEDNPAPRLWRGVAFAAALSAAILTHTLSILLFLPFGLAELVRNIRLRRIDWPVWAYMSILPLALAAWIYPPLAAVQSQAVTKLPLLQPELPAIPAFYRFLIEPALFPLLLALILIARAPAASSEQPARGFQPAELVFAFALAAIPVVALLFSAAFTGIFASRYGINGTAGIVLLFAMLLHRSVGAGHRRPIAIAAAFLFFFAASFGNVPSLTRHPAQIAPPPDFEKLEPALPFVVANGLEFFKLTYYADAAFSARLVYLHDRQAALRFTGANPLEFAYTDAARRYKLRGRVVAYRDFLNEGKPFLVLSNHNGPFEWVPRKLMEDGLELRLLGTSPVGNLFRVDPPPPPSQGH